MIKKMKKFKTHEKIMKKSKKNPKKSTLLWPYRGQKTLSAGIHNKKTRKTRKRPKMAKNRNLRPDPKKCKKTSGSINGALVELPGPGHLINTSNGTLLVFDDFWADFGTPFWTRFSRNWDAAHHQLHESGTLLDPHNLKTLKIHEIHEIWDAAQKPQNPKIPQIHRIWDAARKTPKSMKKSNQIFFKKFKQKSKKPYGKPASYLFMNLGRCSISLQ